MKNRKSMCYLAEKLPKYCVNMPCERCLIGKVYDLRDRPPKDVVHAHKNYVLIQSPSGDCYIIDSRSGKWVMHAQCTTRLTRREAREYIKFYLKNKR